MDTALYTIHAPMIFKAPRRVPIGCAINQGSMTDAAYMGIVDKYQWLTPENAGWYYMVHAYGWGGMDAITKYALDHQKRLLYHPLRWWNCDAPDYIAWITEAMTRYPGINDWVVVNEGYYWGNPTIEHIEDSYQLARILRPDARLWYNGMLFEQYEQEQVQRLVELGLVNAVGIQCHHTFDSDHDDYIPFVYWLYKNNIPWAVTELEVEIPDTLPDTLACQADMYGLTVQMCTDYGAEFCTVWGVDDWHSWQAWAYPLPFDAYYRAKPAWDILRQGE